jgi:peroxiredoxin
VVSGVTAGAVTPETTEVPKDPKNSVSDKENIMALKVGEQAPDFCLESHQGKKTCLRYFHGTRNVVLAFFPLAWTPV